MALPAVVSGQGHELPTCFGGCKGRHRDSDWTLLGHQLLHGDDKDSGIVVGQSDMNYSNSCQIGHRYSANIPGPAFMDLLYLFQCPVSHGLDISWSTLLKSSHI